MSRAYYNPCPCKNCTHRVINCHSTCTAYAEWKQESTEIKIPYYPPNKNRKPTKKVKM